MLHHLKCKAFVFLLAVGQIGRVGRSILSALANQEKSRGGRANLFPQGFRPKLSVRVSEAKNNKRGQPFNIDICGRGFFNWRMARQVRIEYESALYHVMARGDRREAIVKDDADRESFLRTLGEAAAKSGFRIHAYVLMSNHYHLLLETPRANLARGMGWLQNAFTRRMNVRHGLWGHLFGGRYKAILVEPGACFWAVLDYIHLNPVRAGLTREKDGLETYRWSSLPSYLLSPKKRPPWLETGVGLEVCGCTDTAAGRREFLEVLERRVDWRNPAKAGMTFPEGDGRPQLAVYSALRRGWLFGSQKFREKLLRHVEKKKISKANGYHGPQLHDYGEKRARVLIQAGLRQFQTKAEELKLARKGDWRKGLLAAMIQRETTMRLDWISEQLGTGTRAGTCRLAAETKQRLQKDRRLRQAMESILKISILNGCLFFFRKLAVFSNA